MVVSWALARAKVESADADTGLHRASRRRGRRAAGGGHGAGAVATAASEDACGGGEGRQVGGHGKAERDRCVRHWNLASGPGGFGEY